VAIQFDCVHVQLDLAQHVQHNHVSAETALNDAVRASFDVVEAVVVQHEHAQRKVLHVELVYWSS
jgi:hypothetical protein